MRLLVSFVKAVIICNLIEWKRVESSPWCGQRLINNETFICAPQFEYGIRPKKTGDYDNKQATLTLEHSKFTFIFKVEYCFPQ